VAIAWTLAATACSSGAPPAAGIRILDKAPADALELAVSMVRGNCVITQADGIEDDDLHVPVGRAVHMTFKNIDRAAELEAVLGSAHVHVAYGTPAEIAFQIDQPGSFTFQCPTPTPGSHVGSTTLPITAMPAADYAVNRAAYREAVAPTTPEGKLALGNKVFEKKGCNACHAADGGKRVAGAWAGLWGQQVTLASGASRMIDAEYVKQATLTPTAMARSGQPPVMPAYEGQIAATELDAVETYVESIMKLPAALPAP
jgi:mono/diheme cytochrome c family protein